MMAERSSGWQSKGVFAVPPGNEICLLIYARICAGLIVSIADLAILRAGPLYLT